MRQSPIFNGWIDENEPRSNIAELFTKLVPVLQQLKQQRGALRSSPQPPYAEMEPKPTTINFVQHGVLRGSNIGPQISTYDKMRTVETKQRLRSSL